MTEELTCRSRIILRGHATNAEQPPQIRAVVHHDAAQICDDPSLTPTERVLLTILTGYAFGDKPECYPSTATLAKKLGVIATTSAV